MKSTSVVSFLITLLLAGAVCIQGQEPVKDTNGDPVQTGEKYYILPVNTDGNNGDGLVPVPDTVDPFCPFGISQGLFPYDKLGLPVSFAFPYSTPETILKTYYDVTIEFKPKSSFCKEFSNFWEVSEFSSSLIDLALLVGGKPERANSWFQIKEEGEGEGNTYKLASFTGTVGSIPGPWSSASELVLTNDTAKTLLVKFQKVDDPTTATTSTSGVEKLVSRMFHDQM